MGRGVTTFVLPLKKTPYEANQIIQHFLTVNQFSLQTDNKGQYYMFHDPIIYGYRGFVYQITKNQIILNVWSGKRGYEYKVDEAMGFAVNSDYLRKLQALEYALTGENKVATQNKVDNPQQNNAPTTYHTACQPADVFQNHKEPVQSDPIVESNNKQAEGFCIFSFVLSLLTIITSICGLAYGIPILILEFVGAAKGLKTKKKGLAIATFILAGFSTVTLLVYLILRIASMY